MNVRLTRISGGKNLRTNSVVGKLQAEIAVGRAINIFGTPLEDMDATCRWVGTSPIVSMEELPDNKGCNVTTYTGSEYLVEYL